MNRLTLLVPFLISSFVPLAQAQDLPEGKGKDVVEQVCGACHGTDLVASRRATKQGWSYIVDDMVSRGASATNEQIQTINEYLAKSFGQVNVNKGPSADYGLRFHDPGSTRLVDAAGPGRQPHFASRRLAPIRPETIAPSGHNSAESPS